MDYAKLGAAILAGLKAIWPALHDAIIALVAAQVQKQLDQGNAAQANLGAIQKADEAASPVDGMSGADVLRDLQSRGRVRDL